MSYSDPFQLRSRAFFSIFCKIIAIFRVVSLLVNFQPFYFLAESAKAYHFFHRYIQILVDFNTSGRWAIKNLRGEG